MRRLASVFLVVLALLIFGFTDQYVESSDEITADGVVLAEPGYFYGVSAENDGSNSITVVIYDNASAASGKQVVHTLFFPASSTRRMEAWENSPPVAVEKGMYADITCAGDAKITVYFRRQ